MIRRSSRSVLWLRSLAVVTFLIFTYSRLYDTFPHPNYSRAPNPKSNPGLKHSGEDVVESIETGASEAASRIPGLEHPGENVVVSIKTGASEAASKIPALMQTSLRYAPNVLIFSDLEQDIGRYHIYDSLDAIPSSFISSNIDFDIYTKQKALWNSKKDLRELEGTKHPEKEDELAAWTLDKYKFIHVLEKTWEMKPDADWYLLIDADTYLVWPALLTWLSTLDPTQKSYFGSEVSIDGTRFAHGGTGIVLSGAAVAALVGDGGVAGRWDESMKEHCCGDQVLAKALLEIETPLTNAWPWMSGERVVTMPFGAATPDYWCHPALSFHHLGPKEMREFARYEESRQNGSALFTHAELFHTFANPKLVPQRDDWDNFASEVGEFGNAGGVASEAASFEDCTRTCDANEACLQYSYHDRTCNLAMSVRIGAAKEADGGGIWQSGWNQARLAEWVGNQPVCDAVEWPTQGG